MKKRNKIFKEGPIKFNIDRGIAHYTLKYNEPMTRKKLADAVLPGVRPTTAQVIIKDMSEGNAKRPDPRLLVRIATILDVDMNFLFGWSDQSNNY